MGGSKYKGRKAEAFIFDLDGTLIDSGRDIAVSANFVRVHFDLPELPEPVIRGYVGDGARNLLIRALGHDVASGRTGPGGLPVPDERLAEAERVFRDHYSRHMLDHTRPYPGVLDILRRFHRFPLFVATNKPRAFTDGILSGLHLDGAFRRVVGGDEGVRRKPDPAHLAACLEGFELDPARVAVVGDSPNDVHAARAFGAVSVGCTYGLVPPGIVRSAAPDHLIGSIAELADLFPSRTD